MKNFILAAASLFLMLSCSSDGDSNPSGSDIVLVSKTIETSEDGTVTIDYTYNGDKLTGFVASEGMTSQVTYTGDLIASWKYYWQGEHVGTTTYHYTDGKLTELISLEVTENLGGRTVYTHNSNGTISWESFSGDLQTQDFPETSGVTTIVNGEVTNVDYSTGEVATYEYDDKNNPFKNIRGFDKIMFTETIFDGNQHNVTSVEFDNPFFNRVFTYSYNTQNYPTVSQEDSELDGTVTTQYFYQQ